MPQQQPQPRRFSPARPCFIEDVTHWDLETDVVVVGLVSVHEAAALSASRAITFVGIVASLSWLSGVLVFASRADGAGSCFRGQLLRPLSLVLLARQWRRSAR